MSGITKLVCYFLLMASQANGASILMYFGLSTYSHRMAAWPLIERLVERGHEITFLSGYPPKNGPTENVTEFSPQALRDYLSKHYGEESDLVKLRMDGKHFALWDDIGEFGVALCEILMRDAEYLKLVKSKRFDLIVIDVMNNECAYGVAHYQKTKFVVFDPSHPMMWHYDMFGIPAETSWISDVGLGYPLPMSFAQRFYNTIRLARWYYNRASAMYPWLEKAINEGLGLSGGNALSIADIEKNTSLVLTNTHYSIEHSRSLPPLFVPVGGINVVKKVEELPKDLKKFVDESGPDGFIYISFGSAAQISKASPELQTVFFNTLRKFKTRFVWKWEGKTVPKEMPPNVFTGKWMPQNDILAHPNIKGFMTHGGLLGILEATHWAVPLLVFPVFAEQDYNAERVHRMGNGIQLEITTLTEQDFTDAITAILTNPSYKEKMLEISRLFRDRQADPVETAVWWIEFVIRTPQSSYLLPLGAHQTWFVRRSLDVWGTIFGSIFFLAGLLLGCFLCRRETSWKQGKLKNKLS